MSQWADGGGTLVEAWVDAVGCVRLPGVAVEVGGAARNRSLCASSSAWTCDRIICNNVDSSAGGALPVSISFASTIVLIAAAGVLGWAPRLVEAVVAALVAALSERWGTGLRRLEERLLNVTVRPRGIVLDQTRDGKHGEVASCSCRCRLLR